MNNSLKDWQKRNRGISSVFNFSGLNNVAELVDDSAIAIEKPLAPKTPIKPSLSNLLGEAQKGGQDIVTPKQKEEDQDREAEYERANARPTTSQPQLLNGLPSLHELVQVTRALQDGTAFRGDSYRPDYRPDNEYRPESPQISQSSPRPTNANQLRNIFSAKKTSQHKNFSSVSFCNHQEFTIDWSPDDPMNDRGSWRASMNRFEDRSPWEQHQYCQEPDVRAKVTRLTEKIIGKFDDMEKGRLTGRDQRHGALPRRSPPKPRVEREVQNMYSQLHRSKTEKLVEKREALRLKIDAADRRKEDTEMLHKRAQEDRQRGEKAKGLAIDDLEEKDEPVTTKKSKKTPKQIAEEKVARNRQRKQAKGTMEPVDRFRLTTANERKAKTPATNTTTKKAKAAAVSGDDSDDLAKNAAARKITKTNKKQETPSKPKPREMTAEERALLSCITQAEKDEEEEDQYKQAEAEVEVEEHDTPSEEDNDEEELRNEVAALERTKLIGKTTKLSKPEPKIMVQSSKKRKAAPSTSEDAPKSRSKKHKSAAIIENSDEEADYELPDVSSSDHPEAPVRQGWAAGVEELVEEVHHKEEKREEKREVMVEEGGVVVVEERIVLAESAEAMKEETEAAKAVQIEPLAEKPSSSSSPEHRSVLQEASQLPTPEPSSSQTASSLPVREVSTPPTSSASTPHNKRKFSLGSSDEERPSSSYTSEEERPSKNVKKVSFEEKIMSPVERKRKMSIPYIVDNEVDEQIGEKNVAEGAVMSGSEGEVQIMENEEEGKDDGLDDLFEEQYFSVSIVGYFRISYVHCIRTEEGEM
jgi:hypothetical protein